MKIELKGIKVAAFASEETTCYSATLYVDGKKAGTVKNDGRGGCDHVHIERDFPLTFEQIQAGIKESYPQVELGDGLGLVDADLELVCGEIVEAHLLRQEFTRKLKNNVLAGREDGVVLQWPRKKGGADVTEPTIAALQKQKPDWKILNTMADAEEAFALYRKGVSR